MNRKFKITVSIAGLMLAVCLMASIPSAMAVDIYEDNDTLGTPYPVSAGTYPNLDVQDTDSDYYSITVPYNYKITVTITFVHSNGDIDLTLVSGDGLMNTLDGLLR